MAVSLAARTRLPLFLAVSASLVVVGRYLVASPHFTTNSLLPIALTLDFLLWIPLFYWLLLVRGLGWPRLTVIPVALGSLALAQSIIPPAQQGALDSVHLLLVPLELAALLFVIGKAVHAGRRLSRQVRGNADVWQVLRQTARSSIPSRRLADAAAFEIAVFYYALFSWRVTRRQATSGYSMHRKSGYGLTVVVLLGVVAVEAVVVHLLLTEFVSTAVAWLVSLLSIYGALWLIADYQAIRIRAIRFGERAVHLRCGFRWDVDVNYENIARLEPYHSTVAHRKRIDLVPFGTPEFLLQLRQPVVATGIYGIRRQVQQIGMSLDDMPTFRRQLEVQRDRQECSVNNR